MRMSQSGRKEKMIKLKLRPKCSVIVSILSEYTLLLVINCIDVDLLHLKILVQFDTFSYLVEHVSTIQIDVFEKQRRPSRWSPL